MTDITAKTKLQLKTKAQKTVEAVNQAHPQGQFAVMTKHGEVQFQSVDQVTDEHGVEVVEVRLAGETSSGEAHYRVLNPPQQVREQDGVLVEDPVLALAEVVARFGGNQR